MKLRKSSEFKETASSTNHFYSWFNSLNFKILWFFLILHRQKFLRWLINEKPSTLVQMNIRISTSPSFLYQDSNSECETSGIRGFYISGPCSVCRFQPADAGWFTAVLTSGNQTKDSSMQISGARLNCTSNQWYMVEKDKRCSSFSVAFRNRRVPWIMKSVWV